MKLKRTRSAWNLIKGIGNRSGRIYLSYDVILNDFEPRSHVFQLEFQEEESSVNIEGQVEEKLKKEIKAAVKQAGLATKEELPEVILEAPREKATAIMQRIWRCN